MMNHLDYSASRFVPLNLPVFYGCLLSVNRGLSPNPEDTRALDILHREVVEKNSRLPAYLVRVKRILHQQEDVDISGSYFGSHERPKHDKACDLSCTESQFVDALQSLAYEVSLETPGAEMLEHFSKRPLMNPDRQITILSEFRPLAHVTYLS
jgi:hypothetical protein